MKIASISSSFFGRFIGIPTHITFNEREIILCEKGRAESRTLNLEWHDLLAPPMFHLSFLGQIVTIKTADKHYVCTMLAYNAKRKLQSEGEYFWGAVHIKRVEKLLTSIKKVTAGRYLRQSSIERIELTAKQTLKAWFPWVKSSQALATFSAPLHALLTYQNWNKDSVQACRQAYINEELHNHHAFFEQVESNPLTVRQRQACIIDNDNNLLLAGAGTGKTSVMVGRAGYLMKSEQATYHEILLLAYGRKAADEMDDRIKDKLATDKISATTFHSLGLSIIAQVEGGKPSLSVLANDEKAKSAWVQSCFTTLIRENAEYRKLMLEYFNRYYYVERCDFTFKSLGERYQYYNDNDIRSLKDEQVKSFGELCIANELFIQGIAYHYEAKYQHDVKTVERRQYQPDFYLPELNLYIEYYGTDEQGNTAPYINKDEYHRCIAWKRETHKTFNTQCLEFTYAQHKKGQLLSALMKAINERQNTQKLEFKKLTDEQILTAVNESGKVSVFAQTLGKLVGLYKAACLNISLESKVIANSADPKQTQKALALLKPIIKAYEKHLKTHEDIDFEDMINKALNYVKTGQFVSPWRYLMVDEFQDISEPRARLVKALRESRKDCSLFAVGDDWQAIYRFSGADVSLTTQFSYYFGATTQTELDQTFRFNNQIGKVATDFISKNPAQIPKTIKSLKNLSTPAVSLIKRESIPLKGTFYGKDDTKGPQNKIIDEMANGALDEVLTAISEKVCKPVTVYLLARFWFLLPNANDIKRLNNQYPLLKIESQSVHASKGKEADYVIIMGLKKGVNGFPSEKATPVLLDALLAKPENFAHAEERRLFYVALTRAKTRVYLIADMTQASSFVQELIAEHVIEQDEFSSTRHPASAAPLHCTVCETGILKKRVGRYGAFYACSHFPRCDHKEKICSECESPMTGKHYTGFNVCLNDACKSAIPLCVKCNANMVLRHGKKGEFWGCSNYKGNEPSSCKNSIDNANIDWPDFSRKVIP